MEIKEFIDKFALIYNMLIGYIENEEEEEEEDQFRSLTKAIDEQQITENRQDIQLLLYIISKISNNHNRRSNLSAKIDKILSFIANDIKNFFTN